MRRLTDGLPSARSDSLLAYLPIAPHPHAELRHIPAPCARSAGGGYAAEQERLEHARKHRGQGKAVGAAGRIPSARSDSLLAYLPIAPHPHAELRHIPAPCARSAGGGYAAEQERLEHARKHRGQGKAVGAAGRIPSARSDLVLTGGT